MRHRLTRERLRELLDEIARSYRGREAAQVYIVGGGTAVDFGWRAATVDADLYSDEGSVFADVQGIKERLNLSIEFARPEDFVPALKGSTERHVFIEKIRNVSFFHYDPYAQLFAKLVRGFRQDLKDAEKFLSSGMVDSDRFTTLIHSIPKSSFTKYPALSRGAVLEAVDRFLKGRLT